ncbi:MAG: hypothetical protein Q7J32_10290 [Sphingomonadaceae bacterium]|nr:hypothetical protein [Sphingomonadaceae bacterium]
MMTAQVELDRSAMPPAGAAAFSAALAVMTLVAARRSNKGHRPGAGGKTASIDTSAPGGRRDPPGSAFAEPGCALPDPSPATRRLPTGLY